MVSLNTIKNRGKLLLKTKYCPVLKQDTRWGSVFAMLDRYIVLMALGIRDSCGFDRETQLLFPTIDENETILILHEHLKSCQEVSQFLQKEDSKVVTMNLVRSLFNKLVDHFPHMEQHLGNNAAIIHCKEFDNAVIKIQGGNEDKLSVAEKSVMKPYKIDALTASTVNEVRLDDNEGSILSSILREANRGNNKVAKISAYKSLDHVSPTSNVCERLFSRTGIIMRPHRRHMDPTTLEMLIFMRMNKDLWSSQTIDIIINNEDIQEVIEEDTEDLNE